MVLTKDSKADLIKEFGGTDANTGSSEVQVALLSARIDYLTNHLREHKHDHHGRRGLLRLVAKRHKLLKYIHGRDIEGYRTLTDKLGIRQKL